MPRTLPRLSFLIATKGRMSLADTLASIFAQWEPGDQVIADKNADGDWGHAARNRMMPSAYGNFLLFIDDDDVYLPGAIDAIRKGCDEAWDAMHFFRMRYPDGRVLWQNKTQIEDNLSTQMLAAPNRTSWLGQWGDRYAGDADFVVSTLKLLPSDPVWHEDVVVQVGFPPGAHE